MLQKSDLKKKTRRKAARGGRSIRVEKVPQRGVVNSPGEQEDTSAISREVWSQAEDFPGTHDTSSDTG